MIFDRLENQSGEGIPSEYGGTIIRSTALFIEWLKIGAYLLLISLWFQLVWSQR